jgi:hypothetical protein
VRPDVRCVSHGSRTARPDGEPNDGSASAGDAPESRCDRVPLLPVAGGAPCARCRERLKLQADLVMDSTARRQRVLDLQIGNHCGGELILSYIAAAHSHFDLGYALVGDYEEIESGGVNEHRRLHGPWDAVDTDGREYRGLGAGGEFERCRAVATIRFVPVDPGPPWPIVPPPGRLTLTALGATDALLEVEIEVPPPAPWEARTGLN